MAKSIMDNHLLFMNVGLNDSPKGYRMGFPDVIHRADDSSIKLYSVILQSNSLDVLTYSQNVNIV